jgi:GNAT superfamily N-acetyltransferase
VSRWSDTPALEFRLATRLDADRIAALHADSWRRHYRGAYADSFLDSDDLVVDRLTVWRQRLDKPVVEAVTVLAEHDGELIGFAHTVLDDDPTYGALLDNLHVSHPHQRHGIGSRLLVDSAATLIERRPGRGLYLWVLEQNVAGQAFYEACGGRRVERTMALPPGGVASRLNGSPAKLRYAWPDPAVLSRQRKP